MGVWDGFEPVSELDLKLVGEQWVPDGLVVSEGIGPLEKDWRNAVLQAIIVTRVSSSLLSSSIMSMKSVRAFSIVSLQAGTMNPKIWPLPSIANLHVRWPRFESFAYQRVKLCFSSS